MIKAKNLKSGSQSFILFYVSKCYHTLDISSFTVSLVQSYKKKAVPISGSNQQKVHKDISFLSMPNKTTDIISAQESLASDCLA